MSAVAESSRVVTSRLGALGQRIKAARLERKLSQEALATPGFTKSYISAVERGKVRPSLKALEILSNRLEVPVTDLLAAVPPSPNAPDLPALGKAFEYQLAAANWLIRANQAKEAIRVLNEAEAAYSSYFADLAIRDQFDLYQLRASAYLRLNEPKEAREDITRATDLAKQLADGAEEVEKARNLLGVAFYQSDTPHLALEQHRACLAAVASGVVKDLGLKLSIYANIANDYDALGDTSQAAEVYAESLKMFSGGNSLAQQAQLYKDMGAASRANGDAELSLLYTVRALDIVEARENLGATAQISVNMAAILIQRGEYDAAQQQLDHALAILNGVEDGEALSALYESFANLALAREDIAAAAEYAGQSIAYGERTLAAQPADGDDAIKVRLRRTIARALRSAGTAEHKSGNYADANGRFERGLEIMGQGDYDETAMQIELDYANMLAEQGDHARASKHYQSAFGYRNRRSIR